MTKKTKLMNKMVGMYELSAVVGKRPTQERKAREKKLTTQQQLTNRMIDTYDLSKYVRKY